MLSRATVSTLCAPDVAAAINAAMGVNAADFDAAEVYGMVMVVDDSGSIRNSRLEDTMRIGVNTVRDSLMGSAARDQILACLKYLNDTRCGRPPIYPWGPLNGLPVLDGHNYQANGGTPLYDETIIAAGVLLAKWREFADQGIPFRGALLVPTDGIDEHSSHLISDVAPVIADLRRYETSFIPMVMGISDGSQSSKAEFTRVAREMGFEDKWILTTDNSPSEIRRAFEVASRASKAASQGAASFSQTAAGGFGGFGA